MKVIVVQEVLASYRTEFYQLLRADLSDNGIELQLLVGSAAGDRAKYGDEVELNWAQQVPCRRLWFGRNRYVLWQPVLRRCLSADLVIVEHASKNLIGAVLGIVSPHRLAFWGHGADLQEGDNRRIAQQWKKWLGKRSGWWFAYTGGSARRVENLGFPRSQISVVQNSTDVPVGKARLDLKRNPWRCIYVGSLHKHKRLDFLIRVGESIAARVAEFELVVVGDGPERNLVEGAARRFEWLSYLGRLEGESRIAPLLEASVILMPGLVGLVAIDSFVTQTPIITVREAPHSPEFEYLDESNSSVASGDPDEVEFAEHIISVLADAEGLEILREGCSRSSSIYSVESMVRRFSTGIQQALSMQQRL